MSVKLPRIYPITDTRLSGLSHAEQVTRLIAGGATLIQLRDKYAAPREFYHQATNALNISREHGVSLIVNDRVDIIQCAREFADFIGDRLGGQNLIGKALPGVGGPENPAAIQHRVAQRDEHV